MKRIHYNCALYIIQIDLLINPVCFEFESKSINVYFLFDYVFVCATGPSPADDNNYYYTHACYYCHNAKCLILFLDR